MAVDVFPKYFARYATTMLTCCGVPGAPRTNMSSTISPHRSGVSCRPFSTSRSWHDVHICWSTLFAGSSGSFTDCGGDRGRSGTVYGAERGDHEQRCSGYAHRGPCCHRCLQSSADLQLEAIGHVLEILWSHCSRGVVRDESISIMTHLSSRLRRQGIGKLRQRHDALTQLGKIRPSVRFPPCGRSPCSDPSP